MSDKPEGINQETNHPSGSKAEPSGYKGDNPATGGHGTNPKLRSNTPENAEGVLNPSAPGESGTTPGTDWK